jgi:predicted nucleic acid-binding protein
MSLPVGLLDTNVLIDAEFYGRAGYLPTATAVSAVSMGELALGIKTAPTPEEASLRQSRYNTLKARYSALPFDQECADAFMSLVEAVLSTGRSPRPRRLDLMIAATAVVHHLPLFTVNAADFIGCERLLTIVALPPSNNAPE